MTGLISKAISKCYWLLLLCYYETVLLANGIITCYFAIEFLLLLATAIYASYLAIYCSTPAISLLLLFCYFHNIF